ncbi:MAG: GGDEF domain-containing protein [Bacillota bacterium]|nr:GGDEF domain-containing protein [Bacillota bacterium]
MEIGIFAEFKDKEFESEYYNSELSSSRRFTRLMVLGFGILYFLYVIPDFSMLHNSKVFIGTFIDRLFILVLTIIFYFRFSCIKKPKAASYWLTAYKLIFSASYLHIASIYIHPNFLIKCFDIILMILCFLAVSNKWLDNFICSLILYIGYFILARTVMNVTDNEYYAGVVYVSVILCVTAVYSFNLNWYKRQHYLDIKKLEKLAATDSLTCIFNRALFNDKLSDSIDLWKKNGMDFSVIFCDIDNMKTINDTLGHIIGDKVIVGIVDLIKNNLRPGDIFARWGGDEFVILLSETNKNTAVKIAENLRSAIGYKVIEGIQAITCSFGVVSSEDGDSIEELLINADTLLYEAKNGKNMVMYR